MTRDQERGEIARAVESVQRTTGQRVRGWMVRSFPTVHTRELLVEDGGFLYDSDANNDELPYFVTTLGRPFLVVPYTKGHNDGRYLIPRPYASPGISSRASVSSWITCSRNSGCATARASMHAGS